MAIENDRLVSRRGLYVWVAGRDVYQHVNGIVCWFDMCREQKLPGVVYCARHEMLYMANHDNQPSSSAASLKALTDWEVGLL